MSKANGAIESSASAVAAHGTGKAKIAVIGAGSWGTALSQVLANNGCAVSMWARKSEVVRTVNEEHFNPRYLSDTVLNDAVSATASYDEALAGAQAVVIVTPSSLLRDVARTLAGKVGERTPIVVCSKGVEEKTGLLPIEVLASELGSPDRFAVLSGPNHAEEVVRGVPAATVVASSSPETALFFQKLFSSESFRAYTSDDVCGVELCAAFKNVIAIAVGMSYGMGYGDNTAALLLTRGLAEMSRLVVACGGQALTCMGLAGTGDMVATCMSRHSRNRRFGEMVSQGKTLTDFKAETHMVAEGALACRNIAVLADREGVELPIANVVRGIVWEGLDARTAAAALAQRPLKEEFYGLG